MKGTMCKRQQEQAATAITTGTASRVGNIYNIGLMGGNQITRDTYAVQAYNVFGDPTQAIIGAKPTPSPTHLLQHQLRRPHRRPHQHQPLVYAMRSALWLMMIGVWQIVQQVSAHPICVN